MPVVTVTSRPGRRRPTGGVEPPRGRRRCRFDAASAGSAAGCRCAGRCPGDFNLAQHRRGRARARRQRAWPTTTSSGPSTPSRTCPAGWSGSVAEPAAGARRWRSSTSPTRPTRSAAALARAAAGRPPGALVVVLGAGGDRDPRQAAGDGRRRRDVRRRRRRHRRQPPLGGPRRHPRRGPRGARRGGGRTPRPTGPRHRRARGRRTARAAIRARRRACAGPGRHRRWSLGKGHETGPGGRTASSTRSTTATSCAQPSTGRTPPATRSPRVIPLSLREVAAITGGVLHGRTGDDVPERRRRRAGRHRLPRGRARQPLRRPGRRAAPTATTSRRRPSTPVPSPR